MLRSAHVNHELSVTRRSDQSLEAACHECGWKETVDAGSRTEAMAVLRFETYHAGLRTEGDFMDAVLRGGGEVQVAEVLGELLRINTRAARTAFELIATLLDASSERILVTDSVDAA